MIDKDLLQYCKDNDFPISKMNSNDFIKVEESLNYTYYKLGIHFKEIIEVLKKVFWIK